MRNITGNNYLSKLSATSSLFTGFIPSLPNATAGPGGVCIDVRSEPLRRHLEAQGNMTPSALPDFLESLLPTVAMGTEVDQLLCPVLIKPKNVVRESPRKPEMMKHYETMTGD